MIPALCFLAGFWVGALAVAACHYYLITSRSWWP